MINFLFIFSLIYLVSITSTYGWWDNTHMMISSIAELLMKEEDVQKINTYLSVFEDIYPGLSNMITSSIFSDHVRCKELRVECRGLPFADHLTTLNGYHTVFIPYNPLGLDEEMLPKPRIYSSSGINFMLKQIYGQVKNMEKHPCNKTACPKQVGSDFSWNLNLRYFLHLYGDIHVPIHCGYGVSKYFPQGDFFGLELKMGWPISSNEENTDNFHFYIDSIGSTYYKNWPDVTIEEARRNAQEWMSKYPFSHFSKEVLDVDPWDIDAITVESHKIQNRLYDIIDFFNHNPFQAKLHLEKEKHEKIVKILEERVILAGYRLSTAITRFAKALPDLDAKFHSSLSFIKNKNDITNQNKFEL